MGTVTVILLNILIAQMSTTYTQAKKVARLEYDVDRILQLTRMERFPFLVSIHEAIKSRYDMTPGAIVQMCCTPRTSVNRGWKVKVIDLLYNLSLSVEFTREVLQRGRLDQ